MVFNTSITGYQEILTDPSYAQQLVTLTYPHIGNTGTNKEDDESARICLSGLIIRDLAKKHSSWRSDDNLESYLKKNGVVAISDIDTRHLTNQLRTKGALRGTLAAGKAIDEVKAQNAALSFPGISGMDLARQVTTTSLYQWNEGVWDIDKGYQKSVDQSYKVIAYDYGIKRNILRLLSDRGCAITVVPATTTAQEVLEMEPHGVFLSNGPGDPEPCDYAITAITQMLNENIPLFGICLGHQLLCLASGARCVKMKFGHHGANHPVQEIDSGRVLITSQNHGFTVDDNSLPPHLRITHRSLFDGTLQGVERTDKPAYSFQGHPEASPGPQDIQHLFDRFISMMEVYRKQNDV